MPESRLKTGVIALASLLLCFASMGGTLTLFATISPGSVPAAFAFA